MEPSNWHRATPFVCSHCKNDNHQLLEFQGGVWLCLVCSKTTALDKPRDDRAPDV